MSADFLFAACAVPQAKYSIHYANTTVTHTDVAPESTWREPLQHWLNKPENINTIMDTVDIDTITNADGWGSFVLHRIDDTYDDGSPIDPALEDYCFALDGDPVIDVDTAESNPHAQIVIHHIGSCIMDAALSVFSYNSSKGTVYNGEFVTGGLSWGDAPTEVFNDVVLLDQLNFFRNYPIAVIVDKTIVRWVDKHGNTVPAPCS